MREMRRAKRRAPVGRAHVPQLPHQPPDVFLVQAGERDRLGSGLGAERPAEAGRRRIALQLAEGGRAQPEDRRMLQPPGEELDELAAVLVAPLEVVHRDHQRPLAGQRADHLGDALEQPPGIGRIGGRLGLGQAGEALAQLGQQPGDLGQPFGVGARRGRARRARRGVPRRPARTASSPSRRSPGHEARSRRRPRPSGEIRPPAATSRSPPRPRPARSSALPSPRPSMPPPAHSTPPPAR